MTAADKKRVRSRRFGNSFAGQRQNPSIEEQLVELFAHPEPAWREAAVQAMATLAAAGDFVDGSEDRHGRCLGLGRYERSVGLVPDVHRVYFQDAYDYMRERLFRQGMADGSIRGEGT